MSNPTSYRTRANTYKLVGLGLLTAIVVVLQFVGAAIRFGTFSISLVLMPIVVGAALFGVLAGAWLGLVFGIVVLLSGDAALFIGINPFGTYLTVILKGALAGAAAGLVYTGLAKLFARNDAHERAATIISCLLGALAGCAALGYGIYANNTEEAHLAQRTLKELREMAKNGSSVEITKALKQTAHPGTWFIVLGALFAAIGIALLIYVLVKKPDLGVSAAVFAAAAVCPIVNTGIFLIGCRLFFYDTIKEWAMGAGFGNKAGAFMIIGLVGLNFVFELIVNLVLSPAIVTLIRYGEKSFGKK